MNLIRKRVLLTSVTFVKQSATFMKILILQLIRLFITFMNFNEPNWHRNISSSIELIIILNSHKVYNNLRISSKKVFTPNVRYI